VLREAAFLFILTHRFGTEHTNIFIFNHYRMLTNENPETRISNIEAIVNAGGTPIKTVYSSTSTTKFQREAMKQGTAT